MSIIEKYNKVGDLFRSTKEYLDNPCDDTAASFTQDYFKNRSKESVFNFAFDESLDPFSKSSHTVSAFLLGMYLKELVEKQVVDLLKTNTSLEYIRFEYPWFLCCLYHDAFSQYEKEHHVIKKASSFKSIKKMMEIDYDIYTQDTNVMKKWDWPITYKRETVEAYYQEKYRYGLNKYGKGSLEHGILSGYYCFDRLVKNFLKAQTENKGKDTFDSYNDGYRLLWNKDQIWVFGMTADAIIAHNIWHTKDTVIPEVRILDAKERKLSITETPLAYFLSLIDTIEPVKWFKSKKKNDGEIPSEWDIIGQIDISMENGDIYISQEQNLFDFSDWYDNKIKDMKDWLDETEGKWISDKKIVIELPKNRG